MSSTAARPRTLPFPPAGWRLLGPIVRPWRGYMALAMLSVLAARILDLVPAFIVQQLIDGAFASGQARALLPLGLAYLGAVVVAQVCTSAAVWLIAVVAQHALRALRTQLADHLQRLPLSYFDRTPLGDIISRCTADVETVDTLFSTGAINLVGNLVRLLTALVAMLILSLPLTLVALLAIVPAILVTRFFQLRVRAAERASRQALGQLASQLQETLSGVEVVRAFDRAAVFTARFRLALADVLAAYNRATISSACYTPLMALLAATATALLLWVGAAGVLVSWGVTLGTLTAFVLLFGRFFDPITALGDDWQTVQSALSGIERITQALALPAEERPTTPIQAPAAHGLVVCNLTFGYDPERPVVRDVTFTVCPGEQVALVGRTGAGKSSIVQLIAGLYVPWSGTIAVAGFDPRGLADDARRRLVGVVPQQVQLFTGTVWDNLTLGDAAIKRVAVERAVALAGAAPLIAGLPEGYDTVLRGAGRGAGAQLSAGQRQLLALARALVWDPELLLLDEATVAIDSASEVALWGALRSAVRAQRRALLTVAHRLATARTADRVIVLDAGRIIEQGPPEVLIRAGGRFAALVELEAAGWNWNNA
jgi:ATP-binding cassette subfamily B multidrug efflux pump